jgi:hypothetical protein
MSPRRVDPMFAEVARVALGAAGAYGFALGGGLGLLAHGLVDRPTEDIDLFTDTDGAAARAAEDVRGALELAGFTVEVENADNALSEIFDGFELDMVEFVVLRDGRSVVLSLGRLDRGHSPVTMDLGPVLHLDDLVASKVAALINRREVRDYVDVAAAMERYSLSQLLAMARMCDPGLDSADVLEAGRYLDRLPDQRFHRYGLTATQVDELRARLVDWPRG